MSCIESVNVAQSLVKITKIRAFLRTRTIFFYLYFVRTGTPRYLGKKKTKILVFHKIDQCHSDIPNRVANSKTDIKLVLLSVIKYLTVFNIVTRSIFSQIKKLNFVYCWCFDMFYYPYLFHAPKFWYGSHLYVGYFIVVIQNYTSVGCIADHCYRQDHMGLIGSHSNSNHSKYHVVILFKLSVMILEI